MIKHRTLNPVNIGDSFTTNQGCRVIVVKINNSKSIDVMFDDEHRHIANVQLRNLRSKSVKNPYLPDVFDVGYIGVGKYLSKKNGERTEAYARWVNMLGVCYNTHRNPKSASYMGCFVNPVWHNFQNFAEWYETHPSKGKGYELDKDIIKENNREFSPDHCLLVPKEINILFKKDYTKTSNLPKGVNAVRERFRASAYGKHIGYFDTADEAHEAFNKKRKQMIIKTALEWQDQLDQRAFDVIIQRMK